MPTPDPIRIGILGARQGRGIIGESMHDDHFVVTAACDTNQERIDKLKDQYSELQYFTNYDDLLSANVCDAVAVATPPSLHAEHSIRALEAGKHVYCEVIAGITIEELQSLVETVKRSGLVYMMAEQVNFRRYPLMVLNMIRDGVFGDLTYAQCGYIHDLKKLSVIGDGPGAWRYEWNFERAGNYYPTHAIGPVAWWMDLGNSDRMDTLISMDSKPAALQEYIDSDEVPDDHPVKDESRNPSLGDVNKTLIKTERGRLIDLWFDVNSNRPIPSTIHFQLQGTRAAYDYDFARHQRIYVKGRTNGWQDFWEFAGEYEHAIWKEQLHDWYRNRTGSTGRYMLQEFARSIREGTKPPIDVYDAADWSVIIPLSQESVVNGSRPVKFPNFRNLPS